MRKTLFFLMFGLFLTNLNAQTAVWTGGNGAWNTAANWDVNVVPGSGYDVVIPTGSTVNITAAANARSIQVNGNATINLSANLAISQASTLGVGVITNWSSGALTGGGSFTNSGTLNLINNANKTIVGPTTLNNAGTINFNGLGDLVLSNGLVNNLVLGTINLFTNNADISFSSSTTELLTNAGTINANILSGTAAIDCALNNSGTINVLAGTLELSNTENIFAGGVYNVSAAATLQCQSTITCSGTLTGTVNGAFNWAGNFSVPAAATFNFTGNAPVYWNSGSLSGGGILTNLSSITLATAANKSITGVTTLNNSGTITIASGGDLNLTNSTINNQLNGILNLTATGNISFSSSSSEILNNLGTINRSTDTGLATISATLNNSGSINVSSGTLTISDVQSQLNGGVYNVSAGATLIWASTLTCSGTLTGTLNGTLNWSGNLTVPVAATFDFSGTSAVSWSAGALNGGGVLTNLSAIDLVGNANKSISGSTTLNNLATVSVVSVGDLILTNSTFNNQISGVLNLMAANANISFSSSATEILNNYGTINRGGETGPVVISATLNNTGTINVTIGTLEISDTNSQLNGGIYNVSGGAILLWTSTLTISGTLTGLLNGPIEWSGNVSVPTTATFNFSGPAGVNWTIGALNGAGTLTNLTTINLTGTSNKSIGTATTLTNVGTLNIMSLGDLNLTNSTLNNQPSGILNLVTANGNISYSSSATEMLNNLGTINRSGDNGLVTIDATMTNTGTINVTNGTLNINDNNTQLIGGIYNVSSGAILEWSSTVTCSGILTGVLDGPIAWNGNVKVVAANPATFNFTGTNSVTWNGGALNGGGVLTNQGKLLLTGALNKAMSVTTLDNEGAMTLESTGDLYLTNATINNRASGVINLSSDGAAITYSSSSQHFINNYGLFIKNVQNGSTTIEIDVNNYGLIDALLGTMVFSGVLNNTVSGTIKGVATIDLPVAADLTNDGTFAPGGTPGELTVIGNFESTASAKMAVELNGLTQTTQYDHMAIQGNAIFNGTVDVTLGFAASINDTFTIATTTGTITSFGMATTTATDYNGTTYTFSVSVTPDNRNLVLTLVQKVLANETFNALDAQITLAPNPAQDFIVLRNNSGLKLNQAQLIDLNGRIIRNEALEGVNQQIGLEDLAAGTYFLQIFSADASVTKRFIKK